MHNNRLHPRYTLHQNAILSQLTASLISSYHKVSYSERDSITRHHTPRDVTLEDFNLHPNQPKSIHQSPTISSLGARSHKPLPSPSIPRRLITTQPHAPRFSSNLITPRLLKNTLSTAIIVFIYHISEIKFQLVHSQHKPLPRKIITIYHPPLPMPLQS